MIRKNRFAYLYIMPCFLLVLAFCIYPIFFNVYSSLHKWKGLTVDSMKYVGSKNFSMIFKDAVFLKSVTNVFAFMILTTFLQMALGLMLTVLLQNKLPGARVLETIYFLPVVLSSVIVGYTFVQVFEPSFGALNSFLDKVGLADWKRMWIGDAKLSFWVLLAANVFQWAGMGIIYYRAGLSSISGDIYEAAKIDGAGFWKTFFRITLPLLKNTHEIMLLLCTIGCLKFFDLPYIVTNGGPAGATTFPLLYLYRRFQENNNGQASAVAVLIVATAIVMAIVEMRVMNKKEGE